MSRRGKKSRSWTQARQRELGAVQAKRSSNGKTVGISMAVLGAGAVSWLLHGPVLATSVVMVGVALWVGIAVITSQRRQRLTARPY